ncbi:uncharacterized protein TNCV_4199311 [Trichonephila clavipes]|uniref:Uncharacterized protein n=1 Tax=Trichonephila clavipes TaxID=2585209 RepID=A0A8X7BHM5_TRICX|nr:uncharacterized protein TNCV_4199311 [Trichonephila clavipes]
MDAIENPKVGVFERRRETPMQSNFDSTMRPENSGAHLLCILKTLIAMKVPMLTSPFHTMKRQKRGYSSLYGIGIVIDILIELIIDYEIHSKYCPECTITKGNSGENSAEYSIWHKSHQAEYSEN